MITYIIHNNNQYGSSIVFTGSKKQAKEYLCSLAHEKRMTSRKLRGLPTDIMALSEKQSYGNELVDMSAFAITKAGIDRLIELLNNYGVEKFSVETHNDEADPTSCHRIRIGRRIAQLRAEKNMTQGDLANASGVTLANVSRMERGMYSPGLDVLSKIADALGAKIDIV